MYRGLILAAGRGSRMGKLTKNQPKCLLTYKNQTLLERYIQIFSQNKINKIGIVTGYKKEKIKAQKVKKFYNKIWSSTNILYSLYCARNWLSKYECIITYSDIIYNSSAIRQIKKNKKDITILYDKRWKSKWMKRFKNPLSDAETFNIGKNGNLIDIGKKTKDYKKINGQYMGVFKINPRGWLSIKRLIENDKSGKIKKFDITKMLSLLLKKGIEIGVEEYSGNWAEIDRTLDYKISLKEKI